MGGEAAAAAAAIARAIKASGAIVRVDPDAFVTIVRKTDNPLVVTADKSFLTGYKYLTSYKGLTFFTKSPEPLYLPGTVEIVHARTIWVPS